MTRHDAGDEGDLLWKSVVRKEMFSEYREVVGGISRGGKQSTFEKLSTWKRILPRRVPIWNG